MHAKLMRYKSVEDFLKEEIEWHFDREAVSDRVDVYFGDDTRKEIERLYGLVEEKVKK